MFGEKLDAATVLSKDELNVFRTMLERSDLAALIGLLIIKFGHVEHQVDWMLAELKDDTNFETYKQTAKGTPLGNKLADVVSARTARGVTFDPDLAARFSHLKDVVTPFRNELVHSMLGVRGGVVAAGHIGTIWNKTGEKPARDNDFWPIPWKASQILEAAVWVDGLVLVFHDATKAIQKMADGAGGVITVETTLPNATSIPQGIKLPKGSMRTSEPWTNCIS